MAEKPHNAEVHSDFGEGIDEETQKLVDKHITTGSEESEPQVSGFSDIEEQAATSEETPAEEEVPATSESEEAEEPAPKIKKQSGVDKRIGHLTWEREEAKRDNQKLRDEIETLKTPTKKPEPEVELNKPVEKDFENYSDYLDARDDYSVAIQKRAIREESKIIRQEESAKTSLNKRETDYEAKLKIAETKKKGKIYQQGIKIAIVVSAEAVTGRAISEAPNMAASYDPFPASL